MRRSTIVFPILIIASIFMVSFYSWTNPSESAAKPEVHKLTQPEIINKLKKASTGNLADAIETATGQAGFMHLKVLDEAPPGSVLVYVLENGLHVSGIGNLMATTAIVRGLAGAVIDGAARDIEEISRLGFPVYSRSVSPATVVGRFISTAMQVPVRCGGVLVRPGDYIVGDSDGVVVVPMDKVSEVLELIHEYDNKESKMIPLIKETKSMLKALAKYGRY